MKRTPAGKIHTTDAILEFHRKRHPDTPISTPGQYRALLISVFQMIVAEILKGYEFNLGHHLSSIRIQKVKRSFHQAPRVNVPATIALKKDRPELPTGTKIFHTDPFWHRFYWNKRLCQLPNQTVYCFQPTQGPSGNSRKLADLLRDDSFAHLNYQL